jgi:hypothetical protein
MKDNVDQDCRLPGKRNLKSLALNVEKWSSLNEVRVPLRAVQSPFLGSE